MNNLNNPIRINYMADLNGNVTIIDTIEYPAYRGGIKNEFVQFHDGILTVSKSMLSTKSRFTLMVNQYTQVYEVKTKKEERPDSILPPQHTGVSEVTNSTTIS